MLAQSFQVILCEAERYRTDFTDNRAEFKTARRNSDLSVIQFFAMQSGTLRLFIAIELSDVLRAELKRAQKQIQDEFARVSVSHRIRWAAPQNIHLTLRFLGNSNRTHVPALQDALTQVATRFAPIELSARGLGCFPNARRPNTIWCGLDGDTNTTALLAQQIETATCALGFARDERGFTPHLTIGRIERKATNAERAAMGEIVKNFPAQTFGSVRADAIYLIASDLRPQGPLYTILSEHLFTEPST